jgi:hypothetical protein
MRNDTIENRMDITDHVIREISTEALKEMISCVLRHAKFDLVFDTSDDDEDDEVERAVDAGAIQAIGSMIQEAAEIIDVEQVAFLVKRQGADIVEKDLSKMIGLEYRISWLLSNLIEEEISTRLVGTEFENVVDVMTVTSTGLFDFIENEIVQNENDEPAFDETDDSASEIDEDEEVTPLGTASSWRKGSSTIIWSR